MDSAGLRVDLATLDVVERPKPVEPRPKKRLDSVANDANESVGIPIPPYEDAIAQVQPAEPPTVGLPELPESNEPVEDEVMSVLDKLVEEKSDEPTPAPVEVLVEEAVPTAEVPDPPTEPEPKDPPPTRSRKGRQRKRRGMPVNYNVQLQSNCVMLGESLMRQRGPYYEYYLDQKEVHSALKPAHCHNRSFRHMIKLFLSHFWQTWREAEGLPAPPPYAFAILKHPEGHLIKPDDMVKKPVSSR